MHNDYFNLMDGIDQEKEEIEQARGILDALEKSESIKDLTDNTFAGTGALNDLFQMVFTSRMLGIHETMPGSNPRNFGNWNKKQQIAYLKSILALRKSRADRVI